MSSFIVRIIMGVLLCSGAAAAQSQLKEGTGSIAGRVTLGGKPAPGVILTLKETSADERRALNMLMRGSASAKPLRTQRVAIVLAGWPQGCTKSPPSPHPSSAAMTSPTR